MQPVFQKMPTLFPIGRKKKTGYHKIVVTGMKFPNKA